MRARSRRCAATTSGCRLFALRQRRYACSSRARAGWLGWSELAMVVADDVDRGAVRAGPTDRLERGEGVLAAFVFVQDTSQSVLGQAVAAVEVPDAVGAFVGRAQPVRVLRRGPAGAVTRADRQRPELVERETSIRKPVGDLLDPVQLGLQVGVVGLLMRGRSLTHEVSTKPWADHPEPIPSGREPQAGGGRHLSGRTSGWAPSMRLPHRLIGCRCWTAVVVRHQTRR
jgi:hypothetical protein